MQATKYPSRHDQRVAQQVAHLHPVNPAEFLDSCGAADRRGTGRACSRSDQRLIKDATLGKHLRGSVNPQHMSAFVTKVENLLGKIQYSKGRFRAALVENRLLPISLSGTICLISFIRRIQEGPFHGT